MLVYVDFLARGGQSDFPLPAGNSALEELFGPKGKKVKRSTEQSELRSAINYIVSNNYESCLVFAFIKSGCENYTRIISKCEYTIEKKEKTLKRFTKPQLSHYLKKSRSYPQARDS